MLGRLMDRNQLGQLETALADRYAIERELGAGGMATVYLAEDLKHRRKVAIKVLRQELAASVGAERFLREIEIAAGLTHPHILALHDSGEADGFLYYVMPYVEGQTLRQRLKQSQLVDGGPLGLDEALRIARGVAEALDYAHRKHIVHRDVKPENILLVEDHSVVADFGIARAVSAAGGATLTLAGRPVGTPMYMSPEQSMGAPDIDGRADIYSLGLVLYEMLVGEVPRTPAERRSLADRRWTTTPPDHWRRLEPLPRQVLDALAGAMAEDPDERFATAAEFARALPASPGSGPALRRSWWKLAVAGGAAAAVAAVLFLAPRSAVISDRILVTPFENQTGDTALAPLGLIAADWLTRGLQETGMIQVVDARSIESSRAPAAEGGATSGTARALAAARDAGAAVIVSGAYYLNRDTLRIQGRLTDAETGVVLSALDPVLGPRDAPLGAVELLGQRVLGAVASLSDATWPTTSIRPPTYPAYREYVAAGPLIGRLDYGGAVNHFLRAAALDSSFTMPLIYAAVLMMEVDRFALADSLNGVVTRFRSRLGATELRMADYLSARLRGDFAAGLEALRPVAEVAPLSEAPWEVGQLLMRLNRPRGAVAVYEQLDPTRGFLENWWFYWNQLGGAYHMLGEHEAELRVARRGRRQYPNSVNVLAAELHALAALGRMEELERRLVEARALPGSEPAGVWPSGWQVTEAAVELRAHGHRETADSVLREIRGSLERELADGTLPPVQQVHLATISYLAEDWDAARQRFRMLAAASPEDVNFRGYLGTIAAHQGDSEEARRTLQWLGDLDRPYLFGLNTLWQARIAALLDEPDRAVALLRSAFGEGLAYYGTGPVLWTSRADVAWLHRDIDLESLRGYAPFRALTRVRE